MEYNQDTAIALLGIRGMSVSILSAIEKYNFQYILPVIILNNLENDLTLYKSQYESLLTLVPDGVTIYQPIIFCDSELWNEICVTLRQELISNDIKIPICHFCHIYTKIMSARLLRFLNLNKIILDKKPTSNRENFKEDFIENFLEGTTKKIYSRFGIKIYNPLKNYTSFDEVSHLIPNKDFLTIPDPECLLGGGTLKKEKVAEDLFENVLFERWTDYIKKIPVENYIVNVYEQNI